MSEIEKLMQNAGVEKAVDFNNCCPEMMKCYNCEYYKVIDEYTSRCLNEVYPEFTTEKQLEIIKWLMCRQQTTQIELRYYENDFCISRVTDCPDNENVEYVTFGRHSIFDEAIADLINSLWQDLSDTEREEIRRILE